MRKPYTGILVDIQKEHFKDFGDFGLKVASFIEKTIVWTIGLSTGAIVLILTNLDKITKIDKHSLNWTMYFLVASIVSGLLGRILYAIALYIGYSFLAAFSLQINKLALPGEPRQLRGNESSEYIYLLMQEDFNVDMQIILENKKNAVEDKKHLQDIAARKLYEDYSALVTTKIKEARTKIQETRDSIFMIKKRSNLRKGVITKILSWINNFFISRKRFFHRKLTYLSFILYAICAVLFVNAIIFFILGH